MENDLKKLQEFFHKNKNIKKQAELTDILNKVKNLIFTDDEDNDKKPDEKPAKKPDEKSGADVAPEDKPLTIEDVKTKFQKMVERIKEEFSGRIGDMEKDKEKDDKIISVKDAVSEGLVQKNKNVDIENVTEDVKHFINELGRVAKELDAGIPYITSAYRSTDSQAKIMINNWKNNGGLNGGREYFYKLYGKTHGPIFHKLMVKYNIASSDEDKDGCVTELSKYIRDNKLGQHTKLPALAIDLRSSTKDIKKVLNKIENSGKFEMQIGDETWSANPHYHVKITKYNG